MVNSTNNPDFRLFRFVQNSKRSDIFDLLGEDENPPFTFFRLSNPRQPKYIKQGAKWILESWNCHIKIAFTGLIPTKFNSWFFGDLVQMANCFSHAKKRKRKSFVLIQFKGVEIDLYYFRSFSIYPAKRPLFIANFINGLR